MFFIDGMTISLSIGDTGAVKVTASGHTFASNDRAIFTVKGGDGTVLIEAEHELDANGAFVHYFLNNDTDRASAGNYRWDVRYVINPYRDTNGRIVNGDQVITPFLPQTFTLLGVVGDV